MADKTLETPPSPSNLISSLCSIGYDLNSAVADIIDNSIAAGAKNVYVDFKFDDKGNASIKIEDDGCGMVRSELLNAMRFASIDPCRVRKNFDLGKFGLGLKTASLSQSHKLLVRSVRDFEDTCFEWDLDLVRETDRWELIEHEQIPTDLTFRNENKKIESGTIVFWPKLEDLVKKDKKAFNQDFDSLRKHLCLTFHRFIEDGDTVIWFQGRKLPPLNPFNENSIALLKRNPKIDWPPLPAPSVVSAETFLLSPEMMKENSDFTEEEIYNMQGVYFYRSKRLISYGGWLGIRSMPKSKETSLVRVKVDFSSLNEKDWVLDIRKKTAVPPHEIKHWLSGYLRVSRKEAEDLFNSAKENTVSRNFGIWKKERGEPDRIDMNHPFILSMLELAESGVDKEAMEGFLSLLALCLPANQKKRYLNDPTEKENKALGLVISRLSKEVFDDTERQKLFNSVPFSLYPDITEKILKEIK